MFNHTHLKCALATGTAIGAAMLPAAAHADIVQVASPGLPPQPVTANAAATAHPDRGTQTGFDWGDAGIGAGGAVVLIAGCAGGAAEMRRHWTIRAA